MLTLLFGGSFNPIHNGHIGLARWILQRKIADVVWLMMTPHNPLKESSVLADEQARFNLCKKALYEEEGIEISDFELHLSRPSYTWHTLQALKEVFPLHTFALLIGADNWLNFHRWAYKEEILKYHQVFVYPRKGYNVIPRLLPKNVQFLSEAPKFDYSATDIRLDIAQGKDISSKVPVQIVKEVEKFYKG